MRQEGSLQILEQVFRVSRILADFILARWRSPRRVPYPKNKLNI